MDAGDLDEMLSAMEQTEARARILGRMVDAWAKAPGPDAIWNVLVEEGATTLPDDQAAGYLAELLAIAVAAMATPEARNTLSSYGLELKW